jgi:myo-inositol 2-dehydrogenase / D-chiro-inositol 1-dehydrogenase
VIRFGVLGCGRIGRMHAINLASHPLVQLVSVYDVVPASARAVADLLHVRAAGSVEDVLNDKTVDAVLIATPTDTHVPLITAAAKARKAILCEKPIDLDIDRVQACWKEIAPLDPLVMLGFNRRFDPSFKALRDRLLAGEIGKPELVLISSRDPAPPPVSYVKSSGGMFRDMTIHDFDMARYLVGEIAEVQAAGANLVDPAIGAAGDIDTAMITLKAVSGALVHINNTRRCAYGYDQRIEVFGERGMLQAGNRRATTVEAWTASATATRDVVLDFFIARYKDAYADEVSHFVGCLENKTKPLTSYAEGVEALRIADAALESMRSGKAVPLHHD